MRSFTGIFNGKFERGSFYPNNPADHDKYIAHHDGIEMTVEYSPTAKSSRKERMYRFYHKIVLNVAIEALEETGIVGADKIVADEYLKQSVSQELVYNKRGDVVLKYSMDKKAMSEDRLWKHIQDSVFLLFERHGLEVPDSNEFKDLKEHGIIFERARS